MVKPCIRRGLHSAALSALAALSLYLEPAWSAAQVLYDPTHGGSTDPAQTGWLAGSVFGASASYGNTGVLITPAGNGSLAGYSNYPILLALNGNLPPVNADFPVLDGAVGYTLSFDMRLFSEDHSGNPNRAGFSVTLIGSDRRGVEIGFQNDRIFAQNLVGDSFVAGESSSNPAFVSAAFEANRWELSVLGGNYALMLNGQSVLGGALHEYSSYTGTGANAYRTPNFLFLGDNTTSAGAVYQLSYAAISAVPEPPVAALALAGLVLIGARHRFFR